MKFKFAFHLVLLFFVIQACNQRSEVNSTGSPEVKQWIARVLLLATKERHSNDSIGILLDSAELSSKVLHLDSSRAAVLFWKGIIQYEENNYTDAEALFSEAKSIAEKNNYTRIHARCLERQASIHLGTDDPYLALKLYFQSLALCEKAGDSGGMAKVYNVLGFYKGQTGQFDSAVLLLNRAMEINRQLNDRRNMIENLGNLGYVYRQNGKNAEAEKIYHSLIAELIARNDSSSLPVIYYNMAAFRQEDHQLDSAIYYLRKAMVIAEITGDTALLSTLYGNTGEILMDKGSFDSSKVYLNRCLQYSILTDDVETQLQALKFLIKADTLSGKYNDIGSLYNRITVLQDSVFERKQRNNSRTIELQYENEKKRNLIELQEIEIQSKTKVRNLLLLLLITVIAAVVLLGRMIFLRKKNYLKDKLLLENKIQLNQLQLDQLKKDEEINRLSIEKYQDALYIKEKELVSIALGIEQKNELLDLISKRIQESYQKGTDLASLNQIVGSIKAQLTESEDADLFNQRFTNLHQDFFTKLQDAHPELSKTELKFCAYLRIQLSGNQIASIMNVTTEAIRKTRYRIRKKMDLSRDASLEAYIMKF